MNCRGTECSEGGNDVCRSFGLSCTQSGDVPCISCVNSAQTTVQPSCAEDGCAAGGKEVCNAQGLGCRARTTGACFECTNKEGTMVAVASPFICGNGVQEPGEECDDRNRSNGDGCSDFCADEHSAPQNNILQGQIIDLPFLPGDGTAAGNNAGTTAGQIAHGSFAGTTAGNSPSNNAPDSPLPPSAPDTGPAALAVMAAGAAAGYSWMRRRRI